MTARKPRPAHSLQDVVRDCGGTLLTARLPPIKPGQNGGCGAPTYVPGTNGAKVPCGARVYDLDGTANVVYCGACEPAAG